MRVLVTGGSGQIGAAVVRVLVEAGHQVRCLVRPTSDRQLLNGLPIDFVFGDVTSAGATRRAVESMDAVIHTAGVVSYDRANRSALYRSNVLGTRCVLEAAARARVHRFVYTSSIATLGHVPPGTTGDETSEYNWQELDIPYFDTKYEAERLVLREDGMHCIALNPGIVFGPGDLRGNAVRLIRQAAGGRLPGVPPGATTFSALEDVALAHQAALTLGRAGHRYVLGGHPMTFKELFEVMAAVVESSPPRRVLRPGAVRAIAAASSAWSRLQGREGSLTPALAEIVVRWRCYTSTKAARELQYRTTPLARSIAECWEFDQRAPAPQHRAPALHFPLTG